MPAVAAGAALARHRLARATANDARLLLRSICGVNIYFRCDCSDTGGIEGKINRISIRAGDARKMLSARCFPFRKTGLRGFPEGADLRDGRSND